MRWFARAEGGDCQYEVVGLAWGRPGGICARASIVFCFFGVVFEVVSGYGTGLRISGCRDWWI